MGRQSLSAEYGFGPGRPTAHVPRDSPFSDCNVLISVTAIFSFEVITNIQCVCGEMGSAIDRESAHQPSAKCTTLWSCLRVMRRCSHETLSARIRQCFATELAEGYRRLDCKRQSTLHRRTTLRRSICLLPEYLMVSIAKPASRTRRLHEQRRSGLRDFVHLDLSGIASGVGPARSQYTLCAAILLRDQD